VNTVADSMRRQGLQGRKPKLSRGLTRQDKKALKFGDLLRRDFTATAANMKWCGDMTEIPTDEGKLYMATVLDLFSRRLLACPTSEHPNAQLACDAIKIAAAARGGRANIDGVIFHTDRGSTHTASSFTLLCKDKLGIRQSMGRVGSCFDNAAAESFFSTLEHEVLSRHHFTTKAQARAVVAAWCHEFYNAKRRHSSAALKSPIAYETITGTAPSTSRPASCCRCHDRHRHSIWAGDVPRFLVDGRGSVSSGTRLSPLVHRVHCDSWPVDRAGGRGHCRRLEMPC
jgi:putative transposase